MFPINVNSQIMHRNFLGWPSKNHATNYMKYLTEWTVVLQHWCFRTL